MKKKLRSPLVVGAGEILWDMLPGGRQLGGAPANMVCHVSALGTRAALISRVGSDPDGRSILSRLKRMGVDTAHVSSDPQHPTGLVRVEADAQGKPVYVIQEKSAWDYIPFTPALADLARQADAVCFGTLGQRNRRSRSALQKFLRMTRPGCIRILDLNFRQSYFSKSLVKRLLELATVLKLNDEELPVLCRLLGIQGISKTLPRQILKTYGLKLVALTQGSKGSLLLGRNQHHHEPAYPTKIKDTVGAGDSFSAVLALGLFHGWPLARINRSANLLAAHVCSKSGATPRLPASLIKAVLDPPRSSLERRP